MSDVQENLAPILRRAAQRLRGAGLPGELAERMEADGTRGGGMIRLVWA